MPRRPVRMPVRRPAHPPIATIQVWPANDTMRRILRHPVGGGFTGNDGCGNWPNDQFTARRLRDGDITETAPTAVAK